MSAVFRSIIASEPAPARKIYRYTTYLVDGKRAREHYRTLRRENYSPTLARHHAAGAQWVIARRDKGQRLIQERPK